MSSWRMRIWHTASEHFEMPIGRPIIALSQTWREAMEPRLVPIKGGWAALGPDWAVFGESKDEAIEKFNKSLKKHQELAQREEPEPMVD